MELVAVPIAKYMSASPEEVRWWPDWHVMDVLKWMRAEAASR